MLEEIKAMLVRKGIFEPDKDRENSFERADENQFNVQEEMKENTNENLRNRQNLIGIETRHSSTRSYENEPAKPQEQPEIENKSFFTRLVFKIIYRLDLKITSGKAKFLLLKDESVNISSANIHEFFTQKIDNIRFCKENECFSINVEDLKIDISPSTTNELIVCASADSVTMTNISFQNNLSIIETVKLTIKIPLEKSLMKYLCNW